MEVGLHLLRHLSKKYDFPIYKITKNTEKNKRDYGYDCQYHNMKISDLKIR